MNTFLPLPSFEESARVLDSKRLGKQRIEASQILDVLLGDSNGWKNHSAVLMWDGFELALCAYRNAIVGEWVRRWYENSYQMFELPDGFSLPEWFGDDRFHAAHRSNLIRKDPKWYGKFGWKEGPDLPYVWPHRLAVRTSALQAEDRGFESRWGH